MKRDNGLLIILVTLLMLTTITLLSCTRTIESEKAETKTITVIENEAKTSGGLPPLIINTDAPLLLDEPSDEEKALAGAATQAANENAACFVCHANYRTEFLANRHAMANVGCFNCHGESSPHQNDENNITPPETMYSAEKIDPFCRSCHTAHVISPREIITRWLEKKSEGADTSCQGQDCHKSDDVPPAKVVARWKERNLVKIKPEEIVCTDCHGDHRMKVRTIIWDKKSGELLRTNKGN
ncbi:MAG: hypothetical protein GY774_14030 [Planctomycetes bacterium]|nr:hypothetical protein [Planctomycetota bacterium]